MAASGTVNYLKIVNIKRGIITYGVKYGILRRLQQMFAGYYCMQASSSCSHELTLHIAEIDGSQ